MKSLAAQKTQIIERELRTRDGRLVRATFLVTECGGNFRAKLLSVEPASETCPFSNRHSAPHTTIYLPDPVEQAIREITDSAVFNATVESLSLVKFLIDTQPTRAPSSTF